MIKAQQAHLVPTVYTVIKLPTRRSAVNYKLEPLTGGSLLMVPPEYIKKATAAEVKVCLA